jgi:hypothetical protein
VGRISDASASGVDGQPGGMIARTPVEMRGHDGFREGEIADPVQAVGHSLAPFLHRSMELDQFELERLLAGDRLPSGSSSTSPRCSAR